MTGNEDESNGGTGNAGKITQTIQRSSSSSTKRQRYNLMGVMNFTVLNLDRVNVEFINTVKYLLTTTSE